MDEAARYLLGGISYGMVLFLIASGLSLILGVMGILNFAHGSLYMLGAFVGLMFSGKLDNFWLAAIASGLSVGIAGFILERVFLRRLYKQFQEQALLTLGFVYIIGNFALWIWGGGSFFGDPPPLLDFSVRIGEYGFGAYRLALIGIGLFVAFGLYWLLQRTRVGARLRAGMDDREMTMVLGINYPLLCSAIFFLGAFLAGAAGFLGSPLLGARWDMGFSTMALGLIVVIIGGVGTVRGTLLAALMIGIIDTLSNAFFPGTAMFISYLVLMAILLIKPSGLFGGVTMEGTSPPPVSMMIQGMAARGIGKQSRRGKLTIYLPLILIAGIVLIWLPVSDVYVRTMLTQILIFSIFAVSLNLIFGYTGLFSLGHAAFFGISAYTAGILAVEYGVESFWLLAGAGILMAIASAAIFGVIALRVSGVYFIFVTLAIGELLASAALKWSTITGGREGTFGIPYPEIGFSLSLNSLSFYFLALVIAVLCVYFIYRLTRSPLGMALQGIRDNERRMRHLGYNAWLYKYISFIIGGAFAGVAGVLYAPFTGSVIPSALGIMISATVLLMVMLGGSRTFLGPVVGAAVIIFLQYFASLWTPERWPLILGGVFVLTVMFLPGGIGVYLAKLWHKLNNVVRKI